MKTTVVILSVFSLFALTIQAQEKTEKGKGGITAKTPEQLMKKWDANKDAKVSKEEFSAASYKSYKSDPAKQAQWDAKFDKYDKDKDGGITAEEIKKRHEQIAKRESGKEKSEGE